MCLEGAIITFGKYPLVKKVDAEGTVIVNKSYIRGPRNEYQKNNIHQDNMTQV
jgi:hypothetical protein